MKPETIVKLGVGGVAGLVLLYLVFGSFYRVEQTERAVLTRWGKFVQIVDPGLHFKLPYAETVSFFDLGIQSVGDYLDQSEKPLNTYTIDSQEVDARINVIYRVDAGNVEWLYMNRLHTRADISQKVWLIAVDRFKSEMGKVNTTAVAEQRGVVVTRIRDVVKEAIGAVLHVEVLDFQIPNIDFSDQYRQGVQTASLAKIANETAVNQQNRAKTDADTARIAALGTANAIREQAHGAADAAVFAAQGEAQAIALQGTAQANVIKLKGLAEAAAIEAQARALGANPTLVELRRAERWNGTLPAWVGAGPIPFMPVTPPVTP